MKKHICFLLAGIFALSLSAQKTPEPYTFKEFKVLPATSVKNQDQTSTCWAFSTASFLESEVQRLGKGEVNLSEMFVVRHIYRQKCENYVRRQGKTQLSEGGLAHDMLHVVRDHGVVPEDAYPGRKDPSRPFNHNAILQNLKKKCDDFIQRGKAGELPANWLAEIDQLLDAEFGPVPVQFTVGGSLFTPHSYRDYLGLSADDYVTITSFTHHPFYSTFILEIPDNFANGTYYNLPLNEMMRCLNYSVQQGYSVDWDMDNSNGGFSAQNGLAIVPQKDWAAKTAAEQNNTFKFWEPEKDITQAYRQDLFDRQITQDDHLMHITGILDEANSGIFYRVKNSWGDDISDLHGYVYASEDYVRLNTIAITVHKNALPKDVRQRLGLETGDATIEKQMGTGAIPAPTKGTTTLPNEARPSGKVRAAAPVGRSAQPAGKSGGSKSE